MFWLNCVILSPFALTAVWPQSDSLHDVQSLLITDHLLCYQWFLFCVLLSSFSVSVLFFFVVFLTVSFGLMILTCMPPVSPSSPWLPRDVSGFYSNRGVTAASPADCWSLTWKQKNQTNRETMSRHLQRPKCWTHWHWCVCLLTRCHSFITFLTVFSPLDWLSDKW